MNNTRPCLFLFDFDGVLADSLDVYTRVVTTCLARIGTPVVRDQAEYLALFEENFYAALEKRGVDLAAFFAALEMFGKETDYWQDIRPCPASLSAAKILCRDHLLAIVSSNSRRTIERVLDPKRTNGCFSAILGSDESFSKHEKIDLARQRFAVPPERTYYVGDTVGDMREGRAAGVKTVAVGWGWYPEERLRAEQPDHFVALPEDLVALGRRLVAKTAASGEPT